MSFLLQYRLHILCFTAGLLLVCKFLAPLWLYNVPLGYDPGLYRALFVWHSEGWFPWNIATMPAWAGRHPFGLFFFTSSLIKLGVPVDWLIGWLWNVYCIVLISVLSVITGKRLGIWVGACVLLMGFVSVAYYDGFFAMYWKTYAALLWYAVTLYCIDRRSYWAVVPGVLTLITHHQTSLLFCITLVSGWVLWGVRSRCSTYWIRVTGAALLTCIFAALLLLPVFGDVVLKNIPKVLSSLGTESNPGSFPSFTFYVQHSAPLVLFGLLGCLFSFKKRRSFNLWLLSFVWALIFVISKIYFYQRFIVQLDFFLLPIAAFGLHSIWKWKHSVFVRMGIVLLLCVQCMLSFSVFQKRTPGMNAAEIRSIQSLAAHVPRNALLLTLDNQTPFWVQGYLPSVTIGAPGVLDEPGWSIEQWKKVLYGPPEKRQQQLQSLPSPAYVWVSRAFLQHYGQYAKPFLQDSCLQKTERRDLFIVDCL